MIPLPAITFTDNPAIIKRPDYYLSVRVKTCGVLESWRASLFSFEWLDKTGAVKNIEALGDAEREKRIIVEKAIKAGRPVSKPILGIGLQDHIEIGIGRAEFLTLSAIGLQEIPVHIPQSCESDFKDFLAQL